MKKASVVALVTLQLLGTLSTAASADGEARLRGGGGGRHPGGGRAVSAHRQSFGGHRSGFHARGFRHQRFFQRHVVSFGGFIAPSVIVYAPPLYADSSLYDSTPTYDPPPVYAPPPAYRPAQMAYGGPTYSQPPAYSPPPPSAPPTPRVVTYPTGRYELRGDGTSTPYTWVWVPNPPPPPAAPPATPQGTAPAPDDAQPVRQTQAYRWVDEQGVVHWTNRLETVPRRFREQVSRLEPS